MCKKLNYTFLDLQKYIDGLKKNYETKISFRNAQNGRYLCLAVLGWQKFLIMPKTVNVQILQLCLNYVLENKNKGYDYCDISMRMKKSFVEYLLE